MKHDRGEGHEQRPRAQASLLRFDEHEFMSFTKKMRRKYPGHWIALEIVDRDAATSITSARVLATSKIDSEVFDSARVFHEAHPGAVLRVFSTDMA